MKKFYIERHNTADGSLNGFWMEENENADSVYDNFYNEDEDAQGVYEPWIAEISDEEYNNFPAIFPENGYMAEN